VPGRREVYVCGAGGSLKWALRVHGRERWDTGSISRRKRAAEAHGLSSRSRKGEHSRDRVPAVWGHPALGGAAEQRE